MGSNIDVANIISQYNLELSSASSVYHANTRLSDGRESLLVDPGAHDNLAGSKWVDRVTRLASIYNLEVHRVSLDHPVNVGGVGNGTQTCTESVDVPISTSPGVISRYSAPIVPDSHLPALLGNKSLRRNRALIDCGTGRLWFVGPGDIRMQMPPGSVEMQMELSASGHWLLPITEYAKASSECRMKAMIKNVRENMRSERANDARFE